MSIPRLVCLALVVGVLVCCGCGEKSPEEALGAPAQPDSASGSPDPSTFSEAASLRTRDFEPAETEGGANHPPSDPPASASQGAAADELSQAEKAAEGVEKVCEFLLKRIQEEPSIPLRDVESFSFWSERLLQAQMWTSTLRSRESFAYHTNKANLIAELLNDAFDAHIARLERIAKVMKAREAGAETDPVAVSAVESLIRLVERQRAGVFESQQIEEEREMRIVLPEASSDQPLTRRPQELIVNIDAEGRYQVIGKLASLDELRSILQVAHTNNPGMAVVIRADHETPMQAAVAVMNACKKVGIRDHRVTLAKP